MLLFSTVLIRLSIIGGVIRIVSLSHAANSGGTGF
jgi:hypothetical protein